MAVAALGWEGVGTAAAGGVFPLPPPFVLVWSLPLRAGWVFGTPTRAKRAMPRLPRAGHSGRRRSLTGSCAGHPGRASPGKRSPPHLLRGGAARRPQKAARAAVYVTGQGAYQGWTPLRGGPDCASCRLRLLGTTGQRSVDGVPYISFGTLGYHRARGTKSLYSASELRGATPYLLRPVSGDPGHTKSVEGNPRPSSTGMTRSLVPLFQVIGADPLGMRRRRSSRRKAAVAWAAEWTTVGATPEERSQPKPARRNAASAWRRGVGPRSAQLTSGSHPLWEHKERRRGSRQVSITPFPRVATFSSVTHASPAKEWSESVSNPAARISCRRAQIALAASVTCDGRAPGSPEGPKGSGYSHSAALWKGVGPTSSEFTWGSCPRRRHQPRRRSLRPGSCTAKAAGARKAEDSRASFHRRSSPEEAGL